MKVTQCTGEGRDHVRDAPIREIGIEIGCAFYTRLRAMRVVIALIV